MAIVSLLRHSRARKKDHAFVLDIGGEGRHEQAWNLNPSRTKTLAPQRGQRIPRHIAGRADAIPLADQSVDFVLVERTPLSQAALREICRVIAPGGRVVLKHAVVPGFDPHRLARQILPGFCWQNLSRRGKVQVIQSEFVGCTDSVDSPA